MNKIGILNGPNLNQLDERQPEIYGGRAFEAYLQTLRQGYKKLEIMAFQSNIEGELVDRLQEWGKAMDGLVINAGAYSHTSIALADAVAALEIPVVEVHISNLAAREGYRHHSYLSPHCQGVIFGFGLEGYRLAVEALLG